MKEKMLEFANDMSELLFELRDNDITGCDLTDEHDNLIPEDFINRVLREEEHVKTIKERIRVSVLEHVERDPKYFTHPDGNFAYTAPDTYDHAYHMDGYIQELYEKERQDRLEVRYVVRLEVERIEKDPATGEEDFLETDSGETAGSFKTFEDALAAQSKASQLIKQ
jgi:hypothetical protein